MLYFSRWKTTLIWLAVLAGVVFAFPNVLSNQQTDNLPEWVPSKKLTLGLDLQGGGCVADDPFRARLPKVLAWEW